MPLDPSRVVTRLRELQASTGDENGEQRVAWTDTWAKGRAWLADSLGDLPLDVERDAAGNDWYTLRGASDRAVLIGGHMDSVPNGGWLDGCLNVLAGAEVLRRIAEDGTPPVTVRLVDWADEEGARFGRSLFGSSAAAGSMADQDELRKLVDRDGVTLRTRSGRSTSTSTVRSTRMRSSEDAAAYLELHIEQGPVLESLDLPLGVVLGTFGVERSRITWTGQAAHAGSTPMDSRRDALAGAAKLALAIRDVARETATARSAPRAASCRPGIVTSVVETAEQLLDQRHLDAAKLAAMLARAQELAPVRRGGAGRRRVGADLVDRADPLRRDADRLRRRGVREVPARPTGLPGAAPRRSRGLPRGCPDGDALRPEPPRAVAHEARGHEARAPRARSRSPRPARRQDDPPRLRAR